MKMYRVRHAKKKAYLHDTNLITQFWHKTEYLVFPTKKHLFKHLKKIGDKQGWPHFEDFPEDWEVEQLDLKTTAKYPFRQAVLKFDLLNEKRYKYGFDVIKRRQEAAEESLNIC